MYAATAFIIMEAADIMLPRLGLPDWTVTLVIVLLIVGFPISIILSWIFDVTPEGVKKTETLEDDPDSVPAPVSKKRGLKGSDVIIAVMLVAVLILLYPKIFNRDKFESIRQEDGRISIAVMPFQNMTNDTMWNVWQVGIQNELISNLSNSGELSVRQYQTMQEILPASGQLNRASLTPALASEISRKLDANTFIQGGIKSAGREIRLNAQLVDARSEEIFKTFQVNASSEDDIFLITDSLSRLVRNYLEIRALDKGLEYDLRSGNATHSAEAYRYYILGLNSYFTGDFSQAIERLNLSISLDPDFFAPYSWLLEAYGRKGLLSQDYVQIEHARDLLNILLQWDTSALSRLEQISLKMIKARYIHKNPREYINLCKNMLEFDPQQRIIWFNLGEAYNSIQQWDQAIEAYEQSLLISEQWDVGAAWAGSYQSLASAYHANGDHQEEAEVLKTGLSKFPENRDFRRQQSVCALSLGDSAKSVSYLSMYKNLAQEQLFWTDIEVDHRIAHIYANHSYNEEAEDLWRKVVNGEAFSTYHKRCFAEFLILNEVNIDEGLHIVNTILEASPDYYDILYFKGWALYKQGHLEEALNILNIAWEKRLTYRHNHFLAIQEVQTALASSKVN
jgi:tetratricopeptide (TPR) repeat protein